MSSVFHENCLSLGVNLALISLGLAVTSVATKAKPTGLLLADLPDIFPTLFECFRSDYLSRDKGGAVPLQPTRPPPPQGGLLVRPYRARAL